MFIGFASDNTAGAHPRLVDAVVRANHGYSKPYGEDEYCSAAEKAFEKLFGTGIKVFCALNGTGANVLGLRTMLRPWQAVICSDMAHINTDESGAPEWGIGAKILPVPSVDGKMAPESLDAWLPDMHDFHRSTPHVLSITQTTEVGSVYTPEEIKALTDKAHKHGLLVHMDGTRIANAVASLNVDIRTITRDAGVDVLSFGGTKNGFLFGEAVVFFRPELAEDFTTLRKQSLQLLSKMRYVAAQFLESFQGDLWLENARHANRMAARLAEGLAALPHMEVKQPQANAVFVRMKPEHISALNQNFYFHEWDAQTHEVRLMCNFGTTEEEVNAFVSAAKELR